MKKLVIDNKELMLDWDWRKNNEIGLNPNLLTCGSNKTAHWKCHICGYEWTTRIERKNKGARCKMCVAQGYTIAPKEKSLAILYPRIAEEWDYELNETTPDKIYPQSNLPYHWKCSLGHKWEATPNSRCYGRGCPVCSGNKVLKGFNDLATTHPDLLAEWSDKNKGNSPETITYKNRSNVWWRCSKCGNDYQAVVYARANGRICPFCIASEIQRLRKERLLKRKIAKDFEYLLPQLATIYYAGKHDIKILTDTEKFIGSSVTAYMPEIRMIIDVCSSRKEIKLKKYISNINKVKYINISERLPEAESINEVRRAFSAVHIYITTDPKKDLEILRKHFTSWKETNSDG